MAQSHTSYSTTREVTSKWSDVIKNSVQIATEPKQTYLLSTAKDETARRYTFGRNDLKKNRTIMMMGETGTGKSELINMMVNYMLGVKWEDKIRFEIIPDESKRPQAESQATVITAYEIFGLEELSVPFSLTVIDTPGYGDTRGLDKDKNIAQNLYTFLESLSDVQQLDAVCLVVKASQYRLSPSQKYIFDAILSVFGKNMEKNFMILITFSDWMPPPALKLVSESGVPFLKDENNEPVHFLFNNLPPQKFAKKYEETYKTAWDNGTESFIEFFKTLDKMEPQSLGEIKNVLKQHQCLEDFFSRLESQIRDVEEKHKALEDVQKEYRQDLEKNNFEYKYNEVVKKEVKIDKSIIFCPECVALCPRPSGSQSNSSNCSACPKKCSYEVHNTNEKIFVEQNEERTGTHEDLKKEAEGKISAAEKEMSKCEKELKHAEAQKTNLIESCFQCILQLRDLALKFDSASTRQNILRLIEMLKEYNDTEKVETLQKILESTA